MDEPIDNTAHVVILTGNHLCHNPRVMKEAETLAHAGFEVTVLGAWLDPTLKERDRALMNDARFTFRAVIDGTRGGGRAMRSRLRAKAGGLAQRTAGCENVWQLGYAYSYLLESACRERADLYVAHSEQAMAVGVNLIRRGHRVAVDMEDWYSEDLLAEARRNRPVKLLAKLERELLTKGTYASCTSHAMAEALVEAYGCPAPAVIYNVFPWSDRASLDGLVKDRRSKARPSLHWYSQTLGPGRGLDALLAALPFVTYDAEIHLRGQLAAGFGDWLDAHAPAGWRERIFVHPLVHNNELLSRIAEHDIGFAGEQPYCQSRDLTVTNKMFHYLLAGLAVVASDTAGQREIAERAPGAVLLYSADDAISLAAALNSLLASPGALAAAKAASLRSAKEKFCWEMQEESLLAAVRVAVTQVREVGR